MGSSASPDSTAQALSQLGDDELRVLISLTASLDPDSLPDFAGVNLAAVIDQLRERELVHGPGAAISDAVARQLGPFPAGLAPVDTTPLDQAEITEALGRIGDDERRVLERLVWGPPQGTVSNAQRNVTWQDAASPIDRLLALKLLRPVDERTVVLPRQIALVLRGGRLFDPQNGRPSLPRFDAAGRAPVAKQDPEMSGPRVGNDWRPVLEAASRDDLWVQLAYAEEDGTLTDAVVRVLFVAHGSAYLVRRAGARLNIASNRIVSARLLEPVVINDPVLEQQN